MAYEEYTYTIVVAHNPDNDNCAATVHAGAIGTRQSVTVIGSAFGKSPLDAARRALNNAMKDGRNR